MEEVFEFLRTCGVFYIATTEDNKPRVRPFGALNIFEKKLYIQTGKQKDVFHQMEKNPHIEITSMFNGTWIRLEAEVVVDDRVEAKKSMLDANPELRGMYSEEDENTKVLYLKNVKATFYSFTTEPRTIEF